MESKKLQSDESSVSVDCLQVQSSVRLSNSLNQNRSNLKTKLLILLITFLGALMFPRVVYYIFIYKPLDAPQEEVLGMLYKQVEENRKNPIKDVQKLIDQINENGKQKNKIESIQIKRKQLLTKLKDQYKLLSQKFKKETFSPEQILKSKEMLNRIFQLRNQFDLLSKFMKVSQQKDKNSKALQLWRVYWGVPFPITKLSPQPRPLYIPTKQEAENYDQKTDLIIYTPAGRQSFLEILYHHLLKQRGSFFQWHLWVNSDKISDIQYMHRLANENNWIKLITINQFVFPPGSSMNIRRFWRKDSEKNKVYLRIDDDTVWMSPDFVDKMYKARIKDVQPIFIFANIINNGVIQYLHHRAGNFNYRDPITYNCLGNAWKQPEIANQIHEQFLESAEKNETDKWKTSFNKWYALNYERISINSLIYFSNTINSMELQTYDQEQLFSVDLPHYYERKNLVINDPICVHHAFYIQRHFLDTEHPQILTRYQKLAGM